MHSKNTVRYYLLLVAVLFFLFLSGDFGLVDVQKTAIVMAVGIDREEDTFIVTSQIAVPQSSKQGKASETVQLVSRGKTVADAFNEINAKTGWYPKLVFCRLLILGEKTVQKDAFDALDFFLLDEYMSDNCLVATCDGRANELLNVTALVDPSGSVAMQKVLSSHAERVGSVRPSTLREFSIGYFSDSKSGYLPVLKTQPQQEKIAVKPQNNASSSSESAGKSGEEQSNKPVFSASETALFFDGKRVGTLTKEETFAFNAVKGKLRLAAYSVENGESACTLTIKRNSPKTKFTLSQDGRANYQIELLMTAGLLDFSKSLPLEKTADAGDIPNGAFAQAEKRLAGQIRTLFEKCRTSGCDLFGLTQALQKKENDRFESVRPTLLENATAEISVRFQGVR